jgi:RNA polymerase sigma factor (sigma-70 family)
METDYQLIKKIKKDNCSESFKELSTRHCKLFYSICNKYVSPNKITEIHTDLDFVFLKSLNSYKTDKKTKFSTWLANCTRYHCLNYSKNENKYVDLYGEEAVITIFNAKAIENYDNEKYKNEIDHVFSILESLKDQRIVRIFKMRYLYVDRKRPTWKKIGERFNLTSQTIINLHDKGRAVIKRKFDKDKTS